MATSNIPTSSNIVGNDYDFLNSDVQITTEFPRASREMEEALKNGTTTTRCATVSVKSASLLSFEEAVQKTVKETLLKQRLELGPHITSDGKFCIEIPLSTPTNPMHGIKLPSFGLVEGVPTEDRIKRNKEKGIALVSKCDDVLTSTFEISIMYKFDYIDALTAVSLALYMKDSVAEAKAKLEVCDK